MDCREGGEEMKDIPIIFSGDMVRAILENRKSQTRRPIKPQPRGIVTEWHCKETHDEDAIWLYHGVPHKVKWVNVEQGFRLAAMKCPYAIGDRLWVKENLFEKDGYVYYKADNQQVLIGGPGINDGVLWEWKRPYLSPRFMPRYASRITLEIVDVKAPERLQEITEEDAKAEGVKIGSSAMGHIFTAKEHFRALWNGLFENLLHLLA